MIKQTVFMESSKIGELTKISLYITKFVDTQKSDHRPY